MRLTVNLCLWWLNKLKLATNEHRKSKNFQFLIESGYITSPTFSRSVPSILSDCTEYETLHHLLQYQVHWMAFFPFHSAAYPSPYVCGRAATTQIWISGNFLSPKNYLLHISSVVIKGLTQSLQVCSQYLYLYHNI